MQTIILCGGKGTRLREETEYRPKALVEVGGRPIIWHIMKLYAHYGYKDFILTLGYKGKMLKEYFMYDRLTANDFTMQTASRNVHFHQNNVDDFNITFAETGLESLTGERIRRVRPYLKGDEFMVTYGDGVGDIAIDKLVEFHHRQGTIATVTGVHLPSKWGLLKVDPTTNLVTGFYQKPVMSDFISGGFMIFNKRIFDYLDDGVMENSFARLLEIGQLSVYNHTGFWKAMDTYQEMQDLNEIWDKKRPWAVWEEKSSQV